MHDTAASFLNPWANFYVITGSSAAALTGLVFIVITLVAGDRERRSPDGVSVFSTPTVVHFCAALLVSATLTAPWHLLGHPAIILGLTGLYGAASAVRVMSSMRGNLADYRPQWEDWFWYAIVPFIGYATMAVAALRLTAAPVGAMFAFAGVTALLVFTGIHNAWDVVTYIAIGQHAEPADAQDPPPAASSTAAASANGGADDPAVAARST